MVMNQIVFDSENKEFVKISNGIPIIEGKPEIVPTEAMALRVIDILPSGKPQIAFTYRKVNPKYLSQCCFKTDIEHFAKVFEGKDDGHFQFIGRV